MKDEDIWKKLGVVFDEVFFCEGMPLTPELCAKDVEGWDSYKQVEILLGVEEAFAIQLTSKEIDSLRCVGDIVARIREKVA